MLDVFPFTFNRTETEGKLLSMNYYFRCKVSGYAEVPNWISTRENPISERYNELDYGSLKNISGKLETLFFKVSADYEVIVVSNNEKNALEQAEKEYENADFGVLEDYSRDDLICFKRIFSKSTVSL